MEEANSVVCICETHEQAQRGMRSVQNAGIDLRTLSMAGRDASTGEHPAGYYNTGDQMFRIPGIGALLVGGALACWIEVALDDGAGSTGVAIAGAALATLGLSRDSILQYEGALTHGKSVLVLHGSAEAVATTVKVVGVTTHCSHTIHGDSVYDTVHRATTYGTYADML